MDNRLLPYKIINDVKIKKILMKNVDTRPPKFWQMFEYKWPSVCLVGATGTGKTTIIYNIIKISLQKGTVVFIFSNTGWDDDYIAIRNYVEGRGCQLFVYDSTEDDEEGNILENIMEDYGAQKKEKDEKEEEDDDDDKIKEEQQPGPKLNFFLFDEEIKEQKKEQKIRKVQSKWAPLEFICIFDDLPDTELRSKKLYNFIKQSRHIHSLNILSMQALFDLNPKSRAQIRYYLLLDGLNDEKLKDIYSKLNLKLNFQTFVNMYKTIIKNPFNFFYIDKMKKETNIKKNKTIEPNGKFRCNFNIALNPESFIIQKS